MAINLATKYSSKLDERFKAQSFTEAWTSKDYDFDGVKSVKIYSTNKVGINDYNRNADGGTDRFGTAKELGDTVQILTMRKDRSGTFLIDKGNRVDQLNVKDVNRKLKEVWDEEIIPEVDAYRFAEWANGAALGVINATALTKSTIIEAIVAANTAMNNARVPKKGRACFITETNYGKIQLADQIIAIEKLGLKAVANGVVGVISGFQLVPVPDDLLPAGVNFICKWKKASVDPMKLKTLRAHKDPPGVDGDKGEFRFYHDAFVLGNKAAGIYVHAASGVQATPTGSVSNGKLTLTSANATKIYYTDDGSNPKSSETRKEYSAAFDVTSGQHIRAYAAKTGSVDSGILEYDVA